MQRYNPPHDRRHQLNALLSVEFFKINASVRWQYGSGLPYTRTAGFDDLIPLNTLYDVRTEPGVLRVLYATNPIKHGSRRIIAWTCPSNAPLPSDVVV